MGVGLRWGGEEEEEDVCASQTGSLIPFLFLYRCRVASTLQCSYVRRRSRSGSIKEPSVLCQMTEDGGRALFAREDTTTAKW